MHLKVEKLSAARGGRIILENVSFVIATGEALILTGPNGAGKTTLLRTLAGYIRPHSGRIALDGGDPELSVAEQCHFVGHLNAVKSNLTAVENASFWAGYLDGRVGRVESARQEPTTGHLPRFDGSREGFHPTDEQTVLPAAAAALARLGLADLGDVPAGFLSAGQRRRLALSRLLVARRQVWLLDEPTVSLDAASVATFAELASEHLASGGLLIAATHVPLGLPGARTLQLGARAAAV